MIKSLIPFFFQTNLSFVFPLMSLYVFVLSIFLLLYKTNSQPKPRSVFLGYSQLLRGYRCYSPNTHQYFVSTDVTFFENSSMFPINHPSCSDLRSLPFLYPVSDTSPVPLATPPRPLQVYTRRPRTDIGPPTDSSPMAPSSTTSVLPSPTDLPITIRKGTRSSRNPHHIYNFLTCHRLSSLYFAFVSTLSLVSVPQTMHEAMVEEMVAPHSNGTWDLVTLPTSKTPIGCRWVYTVKIGLDGQVDCLKARLIAKGYTQVYGSDDCDNFFPCHQDCLCSSSPIYDCYAVLAFVSVGHQKCLLTWRLGREGLYGATTWVCCLGGVWIGMQATSLII